MTSLFLLWIIFLQSVLFIVPSVQGAGGNSEEDCEKVISSQYGWLRTPNFPDRYPRYSRCRWTVMRLSPDICTVKLTFVSFRVTRMAFTDCSEDYLEVENGKNRQRICGDLPKGTLKFVAFPSDSDQLVFHFRSTFHENGGFEIQVKQMHYSCPRITPAPTQVSMPDAVCSRTVVGRVGRLLSPDGDTTQECSYTIRRSEPRACLLQMDFSTFDVLDSAGCLLDHLILPDGQKMCGLLGGTRKFLQFPPGKDELVVKSKGRHNRFNIQVTQLPGPCAPSLANSTDLTGSSHNQCDQDLRGLRGTLVSPGYPGSFGPNFHCVYRLHRDDPSVCSLEMDFVEFSVGKHNPTSCGRGAWLELPGRNRLCHDMGGRMIIHVSEFQDPVVFEFHSDFRTSGKGFRIELAQLPDTCPGSGGPVPRPFSRCYQEVTRHSGHFSSPSVPACELVLQRADPSVCTARLQISARHRLAVPCAHNFVRLPDGSKMCVSVSERTRDVSFAEGSDSLVLDYIGWHTPHFNLWVEQMRDSCNTRRHSDLYTSMDRRWLWKIMPR